MEVSVDAEEDSMLENTSGGETQFSQSKKPKLSENLEIDQIPDVSPVLHHKIPMRSNNDADDDSEECEEKDDSREQTNLFGVNFLVWFEVGIEGNDPMD